MFDKIRKTINPFGYAIKKGMKVGKGVSLAGRYGVSFGSEPYLITLGDYVRISGDVKFFTHDGGTWAFRDLDEYKKVFKFGPISVGDHTFIGNGVMILPGVKIGSRCVIGAGAVVTKDVPDNSVVAGVPARVIMSTWEYADKIKASFDKENHDLASYKSNKKEYLISRYMR